MGTRKKRELSTRELKRKHSKWMKSFVDGVRQIIDSDRELQSYLWMIVLQDCLYNQSTSHFFSQMYERDEDFYKVDTDNGLEDYQLSSLNKKRLFEGMEKLIKDGGRRKFSSVLSQLETSYQQGVY